MTHPLLSLYTCTCKRRVHSSGLYLYRTISVCLSAPDCYENLLSCVRTRAGRFLKAVGVTDGSGLPHFKTMFCSLEYKIKWERLMVLRQNRLRGLRFLQQISQLNLIICISIAYALGSWETCDFVFVSCFWRLLFKQIGEWRGEVERERVKWVVKRGVKPRDEPAKG